MALHVPSIIRRIFGLTGETPEGAVPASTGGATAQFRLLGVSDIDGLVAALGGKANTSHTHSQSDVTNLAADLAGKSAVGHGHAQSDITGLVTALANKSNVGHQHLMEDITLLENVLGNKSEIGHTHNEAEIANRKGVIWTTSFDVTLSPGGTSTTLLSACPYTLTATDRVVITAHVVPTVNESSFAAIGVDGNYGLWQAALLAGSSAGCVTRSTLFRSPITSQVGGWNSFWTTTGQGANPHGFISVATMDLVRTTLRVRGDGMSGGTLRACGWIEVHR